MTARSPPNFFRCHALRPDLSKAQLPYGQWTSSGLLHGGVAADPPSILFFALFRNSGPPASPRTHTARHTTRPSRREQTTHRKRAGHSEEGGGSMQTETEEMLYRGPPDTALKLAFLHISGLGRCHRGAILQGSRDTCVQALERRPARR